MKRWVFLGVLLLFCFALASRPLEWGLLCYDELKQGSFTEPRHKEISDVQKEGHHQNLKKQLRGKLKITLWVPPLKPLSSSGCCHFCRYVIFLCSAHKGTMAWVCGCLHILERSWLSWFSGGWEHQLKESIGPFWGTRSCKWIGSWIPEIFLFLCIIRMLLTRLLILRYPSDFAHRASILRNYASTCFF